MSLFGQKVFFSGKKNELSNEFGTILTPVLAT